MTPSRSRRPVRSRGAFTLVEILIVVVILGILAAVVVPMMANASEDSRLAATMTDIKEIHQVITQLYNETGQWPADESEGVMPPQFVGPLGGNLKFAKGPPIGGQYDWDNGFGPFSIAISIHDPTTPIALWTQIDLQMDNGDLTTGWIRRNGVSLQFRIQD